MFNIKTSAKFAWLDQQSKSHLSKQLNIKQVNFTGDSINMLDKGRDQKKVAQIGARIVEIFKRPEKRIYKLSV